MVDLYDLAIIGGGINGCGIARDAAGRGASVYLCEMNDLASGTSSWSTKLVHGGLRYLEYYEFRLVHEALAERERLWAIAPHIIAPLRFVLPHHKGLRPAWLLRLGLFLYDHLGGRKLLPATKTLNLATDAVGRPLKRNLFGLGFEYSDCRVDDARLTVLNAMAAQELGARIETRTRAVSAVREGDVWCLSVEDTQSGEQRTLHARALVNAAGPWVSEVLGERIGGKTKAKTRLVQGSHIVVRKLFDHDRAYIFQNADGRIIFAIPYLDDFTLIGTTDSDYHGDPGAVRATPDEIEYLCGAANAYFEQRIDASSVVWAYSGVRPLYDDGVSEAKAATRDYVLELDAAGGQPPVLSVFGGKITTYRRLTETALEKLGPYLPPPKRAVGWTGQAPLPGGDFPVEGREALIRQLQAAFPALPAPLLARYATTYGTRTFVLLEGCSSMKDLGRDFGSGLFEREVTYLRTHEWARTAEDIVWRRTKLGLWMTPIDVAALDVFLTSPLPDA